MTEYLPDGMNGDLIDDLVADIIATEGRHIEVSQEAIERLTTQYPALTERYGDWNLGIDFRGPGRRLVRADVHRSLRDKGMSLRAIAAVTGVSEGTVRSDLAAQNYAPDEVESAQNYAPDDSDGPRTIADHTPPGPYWQPLGETIKAVRQFTDTPVDEVAASVPSQRRAGTAKRLRELGRYLGAIAMRLEDMS